MEESNVSFMHTVLNDYNNWLAKKTDFSIANE